MRIAATATAPTPGWLGLVARVHAAEHAAADRAGGAAWSCGCVCCELARRDVALLALRREERAANVAAVGAQLEAVGEELIA